MGIQGTASLISSDSVGDSINTIDCNGNIAHNESMWKGSDLCKQYLKLVGSMVESKSVYCNAQTVDCVLFR